jgi:two-component system sensor histidine kinase HydH
MKDGKYPKNSIFSSKLPFKVSRTALGLILATLFLAVLLTFSTLENINRAQGLMERFLLQKGETIIRAVEAALRTSLMHHMDSFGDPLHTLLAESGRENDIVFILITDGEGNVIAQTNNAPDVGTVRTGHADALSKGESVTAIDKQTGIFTISKRLAWQSQLTGMPITEDHTRLMSKHRGKFDGSTISIGLFTEGYVDARKQDIQHAIFMGAILFLVGSAGLYLLFSYHSVRVTKSTLANMKLYTDNVVESIPVGIVTLDAMDRVVSCNRKTEDILGRPFNELHGKNINDAFPGCHIQSTDIRKSILDYSADCSTGDGRNVALKIGGSSLVDSEGITIGTVLVIRDMSLIRDMELQLERSRRMAALGKMAAGIAHEIRNPLGTLRGFAHYFGSQDGATEESKSYAALMVSEVDRLNRNVSGLLQFARPRDLQFVSVNVDALIAKTVALMEGDFANHALNFHWQCNTDLIVEADPDLMLQVLMNLLKNSISATPSGGEISITGSEDRHHVRIIVSDTGDGMTEQECERMFDPFFTTRKSGTGLGLAVSHQIIEQHQGVFEVDTAKGRGTTVMVVLPKKRGVSDGR